MQRLNNVEFFNSPEGEVQIRDEKGVRTYMEEDKELTDALFSVIELDYPKAFKALSEIYNKSKANAPYFKYRCAHRFSAATSGCMIKYPIWTSSAGSTSRMLLVRWWGSANTIK